MQNITRKVLQEFKTILDNTGYWSEQTRDFISQFPYHKQQILHQKAHAYTKYNIAM